MDLRAYYEKVRATESEIGDAYPVIVSKDTQDGGKGGKFAEVPKAVAAKMVVDGAARLATAEETKSFHEAQAAAKRAADQAAEAAKVQLTILSANDMAKLTGAKKDKV